MLAEVGMPRLGAIRQANGVIVPFFGLASNSIAGKPLPYKNVLSGSFSDKAGLLLMPDRIVLLDANELEIASYPSSDANAIVSVSEGLTSAVVWLPSETSLLHWNGNRFESTELDKSLIPGKVLDLVSAGGDNITLLLQEATGRSEYSLEAGQLRHLRYLPAGNGPALLIGSAVLIQDGTHLQLVKKNGDVNTIPLSSAAVRFEKASRNAVHILSISGERHWILELGTSGPLLSELPRIPNIPREVIH
jgi:hypothetical protein